MATSPYLSIFMRYSLPLNELLGKGSGGIFRDILNQFQVKIPTPRYDRMIEGKWR